MSPTTSSRQILHLRAIFDAGISPRLHILRSGLSQQLFLSFCFFAVFALPIRRAILRR